MQIKLNCDMGEGYPKMDKQIMPYINMTNLACGFHAGNVSTMNNCVKLAKKYNVDIGAHPSYADKKNFGRQSIPCSSSQIKALIISQLTILDSICKQEGMKLSYVKPHGALYNDMMANTAIFLAILKAIKSYNQKLKLMVLSTNKNKSYKKIAKEFGIKLIYEVFADRNYTQDGFLVNRNKKNAMILKRKEIIKRIKNIQEKNTIISENGKILKLRIDTICVHGDNKNALKFIKKIHKLLIK